MHTLEDNEIGHARLLSGRSIPPVEPCEFYDKYDSTWAKNKPFTSFETTSDGTVIFREKFFGDVSRVWLTGDHVDWERNALELHKDDKGYWTAPITSIEHKMKVRTVVELPNGEEFDRVPTGISYAVENPDTHIFDGVYWCPKEKYEFKNLAPSKKPSRIYEAHIGIAAEDLAVSQFDHFTDVILPRIASMQYDTVLLVGLQEHTSYSSFGWHVTSPYAICSRYGTPEDFKRLVDVAHGLGLLVLVSLIQTHAAPSELSGLGNIDGSYSMLRKKTPMKHPLWDAPLFDVECEDTVGYLLDNAKFYMREYNIDGFRFEAVSSFVYHHQDHRPLRTNPEVCYEPGRQYLRAFNRLIKTINKKAFTIASVDLIIPGITDSVDDGGFGFDYVQDIRVSTEVQRMLLDGHGSWNIGKLVEVLEDHRGSSNCVTAFETYETSLCGRRPLKIAMFTWESLMTHAVGGVAPHVTELAAALTRLGHEVHVYTRSMGQDYRQTNHYGVYYHECPFALNKDFVVENDNMCASMVAHMHATEAFMNQKFSICHAHDWLAVRAIQRAKTPTNKVIMTIHSTEFGRCGNVTHGGQSSRIRDIESEGCALADRLLCVSGVLAQEVCSMYGVHSDKIRVAYNGIHAQQYDGEVNAGEIKAEYGVGALDPVMLFVGRMTAQKGADILIEAIPHVLKFRGDCKFWIVGDGYLLNNLKNRANAIGVGHATQFLGQKGGKELRDLYKACDAVLVPSRNEPFGIVILEAWSASKPVVATTAGGPRDFVTPNVDGVLVDPNPGSVSWGVCEMLKDFDHTRWMGSRGRVKAAYSFSWDTIALQTREAYYEALGRADAPYAFNELGDSALSVKIIQHGVYDHMGAFDDDPDTRRGVSYYKMLRLLQSTLGGSACLSFMGTEFGHPDCVDMPRQSNSFSHFYARRSWRLSLDKELKFKFIQYFDAFIGWLEKKYGWKACDTQYLSHRGENDIVALHRSSLMFIFNFHTWEESAPIVIRTDSKGASDILANSDDPQWGGLGRKVKFDMDPTTMDRTVTVPPTTAVILGPSKSGDFIPGTADLMIDAITKE